MIVEVFKTNVSDPDQARMLLDLIHTTFSNYSANFDLEDCDKILRVEACHGPVQSSHVISIIMNLGFAAEVLSDDIPELLTF